MAVYQLITIRIDPFGARHIITTPRCLAACAVTWAVAFVLSIPFLFVSDENVIIVLNIGVIIVVAGTGICYCLVYNDVARGARMGVEDQCEGRRKENKKILRTFGIVYGTTAYFVLSALIVQDVNEFSPTLSTCSLRILHHLFDVLSTSNVVANSVIYWWRLKEFRSIISKCYRGKRRHATVPIM